MIQQTIDELRELKKAMEEDHWGEDNMHFAVDKAIIACEQLRKARKKAKRWKRKYNTLVADYDDTATDRSKECNYCKYLDDPSEKTCKNCYHYYTDKFAPNTKGGANDNT